MSREPSAHSMTIDHVELGEGAREHIAVRLREAERRASEAEARARRIELEHDNARSGLSSARKEIARLGAEECAKCAPLAKRAERLRVMLNFALDEL